MFVIANTSNNLPRRILPGDVRFSKRLAATARQMTRETELFSTGYVSFAADECETVLPSIELNYSESNYEKETDR